MYFVRKTNKRINKTELPLLFVGVAILEGYKGIRLASCLSLVQKMRNSNVRSPEFKKERVHVPRYSSYQNSAIV